MLTIRDYDNNEYPLLAVKTVNEELNGNHDIELKVPQQRNNNLDLKQIDKLWEINYKTVDYKIMYVKQITKGDSFYLDIRATPLFYFDMDKQIIHENKDGHYTGKNAFDVVFKDSGYQYILVDFVEAIQIEGFGKGETRLEMFKRLIDRFSLEFYIVGKTVYLKKLIGNDTNFLYKYKLNASNVSKSVDASNYFTHIKGFGNFEESAEDYLKQAKLKREYTSPLASVLGKYEGKPIIDGRVTDKKTLDKMMKEAVEKSLEISIEGNLHDVRSIYKEAVPLIGDRVFLIDERINLEQEIRIQSLKQTFDVNDKLVNCEVTFGSESIRSRYKSNLQSVAKDFNSLLKGEMKLPLWSLDEVARGMITKIHASENELRYGDFGIQAIDKNNPNNIFGLNSQGWYISTDGGRTARTVATADGIVADSITTGTLRGIYIEGVEISGGILQSLNNINTFWNLETGEMKLENANFEIGNGADIIFLDANNKLKYYYNKHYSGVGVGITDDGNHVQSYLGTSPSPNLSGRTEEGFSGFFASTNERYEKIGIGNSIYGRRLQMLSEYYDSRGNLKDSFGYIFDLNKSEKNFRPLDDNVYDLGRENNRWKNVYAVTGVFSNVETTRLKAGSKAMMSSSSNSTRIGPNTNTGGTYLVITDGGKVGVTHNGNYTHIAG